MKNIFKPIFLTMITALCFSLVTGCTNNNTTPIAGMPNPWTDCNTDYFCAEKAAGFSFPIRVENMKITAMKDMIQVIYPLDSDRTVVVRKTTEELYNKTDISGDYNNYPIKDTLRLDNGVKFVVRRDESLIYVAYFGAESGYYSINCSKGITKKELQDIYAIIANVEAPSSEK